MQEAHITKRKFSPHINKHYLESDLETAAYPRHRRYTRNIFESASPYRNKTNLSTLPRKLRLKSRLFDDEGEILLNERLRDIHRDFEARKSRQAGEIYRVRQDSSKTPLIRRMADRNLTPELVPRREPEYCIKLEN